MFAGPLSVDDPGDTNTIVIDRYGAICVMEVGAADETRTLAAPTRAGILAAVSLSTLVPTYKITLTVTGGYNFGADTEIVFQGGGDAVWFMSVLVDTNYRWRMIGHEGTNAVHTLDRFDQLFARELKWTAEAEVTEHGAGAIGTGVAPETNRYSRDEVIITEIRIDLTGLASVATANDVIGLAAGGVAYIGRNVVATNGIIFKIELICLETPVGGDDDVNVVANVSAALAHDGAGGTTYGVNGGDAVAGQVVEDLVQGLTANHYFYLTAGTGDTAAAYTAGQFIIRLYGHALLS